jgi:hypothetical protein
MRRTWVSLALTLGLGATGMLFFPYRAITPGTLSEGHRAQRDGCFSCHTLLAGAPVAKCVTCHRPGEIGVRSVLGEALRKANPGTQRIHRVVGGQCDRCHFEHGGPFGRDAARRFSHELLPADVAAGCAACHSGQKPADALHATLTAECTPCHGTQGWKPATYDHDRSFRFDRNHPPRCTDCHPAGTPLKEYTCTGCHEHSLDRMEREHREEGVTDLGKCRRCHPSGDEDDTIRNGRKREKGGDDED